MYEEITGTKGQVTGSDINKGVKIKLGPIRSRLAILKDHKLIVVPGSDTNM